MMTLNEEVAQRKVRESYKLSDAFRMLLDQLRRTTKSCGTM